MQNHFFLLGEVGIGALLDLYIIFRRLGTSTSSIHDKNGGELTETISFYLLAIMVVKYCRHEPNINQFPSDECDFGKAFCQSFFTSAVSLWSTLALSLAALLNLFCS